MHVSLCRVSLPSLLFNFVEIFCVLSVLLYVVLATAFQALLLIFIKSTNLPQCSCKWHLEIRTYVKYVHPWSPKPGWSLRPEISSMKPEAWLLHSSANLKPASRCGNKWCLFWVAVLSWLTSMSYFDRDRDRPEAVIGETWLHRWLMCGNWGYICLLSMVFEGWGSRLQRLTEYDCNAGTKPEKREKHTQTLLVHCLATPTSCIHETTGDAETLNILLYHKCLCCLQVHLLRAYTKRVMQRL